jgi:DNA processing protein
VFGDPAYPAPLAAIDDAPMVLSLIGDITLLSRDGIAVVGARNASTNGRNFARRLACDLAEAGLAVISGLARGIDAAAHTGALDHATVAVLGGGVDVKYPRENAALHDAIADKGLLASEVPCGIQPQARHFPRRNRIISGLSLGVIVVEAALRSGSLITARLAGEQGRDVFAVPGSPLDPRCKGTNDLIRKGAMLTETAEDVLMELAPARAHQTKRPLAPPTTADSPVAAALDPTAPADARDRIGQMIGPSPLSIDDIVRESGFPINTVWSVLLEMELAGQIERQPGNLIARLAT